MSSEAVTSATSGPLSVPWTVHGLVGVNGTITRTADSFDAKLHLNTEDFKGVGLTTGLQYIYHQQTRQENEVTFNPFTQRFETAVSYSVISQGSTDNFMADFAYSFTYPPANFEITRDEARCTG